METLKKTIKEVKNIQETVGTNMCDTLKGDCNLCPFKSNCILTNIDTILLNLDYIKQTLKDLL